MDDRTTIAMHIMAALLSRDTGYTDAAADAVIYADVLLAELGATEVADDGWIDWLGGDCPVEKETVVSVRTRGGTVIRGTHAYVWRWRHGAEKYDSDIVAYMVTEGK